MCVCGGGGGDVEAVLQCTTRITRVLGEGLCFGVCGFFFFLGGGGGGRDSYWHHQEISVCIV